MAHSRAPNLRAKSLVPSVARLDEILGGAPLGDLLAQRAVEASDGAAIGADDRGELVAEGLHHADAFDLDIDDPVVAATVLEPPFGPHRLLASRLDLAMNNGVARVRLVLHHLVDLEGLAGILREAGSVGLHHQLLE